MDEAVFSRTGFKTKRLHSTLRYSKCDRLKQEHYVSCKDKAHDVRYHWIRKAIEEKLFQIRKIHTDENTTDMMTKVITKEKLARCIKNTGTISY